MKALTWKVHKSRILIESRLFLGFLTEQVNCIRRRTKNSDDRGFWKEKIFLIARKFLRILNGSFFHLDKNKMKEIDIRSDYRCFLATSMRVYRDRSNIKRFLYIF